MKKAHRLDVYTSSGMVYEFYVEEKREGFAKIISEAIGTDGTIAIKTIDEQTLVLNGINAVAVVVTDVLAEEIPPRQEN